MQFSTRKLRAFYGNTKWRIGAGGRIFKHQLEHLWLHYRPYGIQTRRATGFLHGRKAVHDLWEKGEHPEALFFRRMQSIDRPRVLEIGSRRIVAPLDKAVLGPKPEYVGLDIESGPNVDVVGDAHELSRIFPAESFDGIYSTAVFEHIAMPWQVAREINKVLKPGGLIYIGTHHSYPNHELPWDFWRYGWGAFASIFNEESGFTILEQGLGHRAKILPWGRILHTDASDGHYLFTMMVAMKTGEPKPVARSWTYNYRDALPVNHTYPKGTYQLKEEKRDYGRPAEVNLARFVPDHEWLAEVKSHLLSVERGLLLCSSHYPVQNLLQAIPDADRWDVELVDLRQEDPALLVQDKAYDAMIVVDILNQVPHPWETADRLGIAIKPGGVLISRERAMPNQANGAREFWCFTSESLRLVYHPQAGFEQVSSYFAEPVLVAPANFVEHQGVVKGPAFRWACGIFRRR